MTHPWLTVPYWLKVPYASWRNEHGHSVMMHKEAELEAMSRVPIMGVVGSNGSGKSLLVAELCRRSLEAGRPVLSTVRLLDWHDPRPCPGGNDCDDPAHHVLRGAVHGAKHPLYTRWSRWGQVDEMGDMFDCWADEITGIAGSRDSTALPKYAQNLIVQLRRRDAVVRWTSPALSRADLLLREVSMGIVLCEGFGSVVDVESGRRFPKKRLFKWDLYEKGVGDVTDHALVAEPPLASSWFWGPRSDAFAAYDTLAPVSTIGRVTSTGCCEVCEGTRRRPECVCSDYIAEKAARSAGAPSGVRNASQRHGVHEHVYSGEEMAS